MNMQGTGGAYGISFRRTEADRRPARVVLRPNDSPGDMAKRRALSNELREKIIRKNRSPDAPKTYVQRCEEEADAQRVQALRVLADMSSACNVPRLADAMGLAINRTQNILKSLIEMDLVDRGEGHYLNATISDAGRDYLEGCDQ